MHLIRVLVCLKFASHACAGLMWLRIEQLANCCEQGNEHAGCKKCGIFFFNGSGTFQFGHTTVPRALHWLSSLCVWMCTYYFLFLLPISCLSCLSSPLSSCLSPPFLLSSLFSLSPLFSVLSLLFTPVDALVLWKSVEDVQTLPYVTSIP